MNEVKVVVFQATQYDGDAPPEDLSDFIAWLQARQAEIPEEHRTAAKIELGATINYGQELATLEIHYTRPKTPDEIEAEAAEQEKRLAIVDARLRAEYEVLKRRFEG